MKYQRYSAYKDSGIDWLGSIPTHWESLPLKRVSSIQLSNVDKKTVDDQQPVYLCNYVDVYKNERISANMPFMLASASDEQISRLSLKQGDVIITKDSESPDDIGVPALISEDLTGVVCGYHLALIRPETTIINGQFLLRFLQGSFARAQFSVEAVGMTRYGLSKSSIVDSKIITPPLSEQIAIASFLDREIAKIDALIAKQERFIALLQEKRQALISHVVTKGQNSDVPMKDSGMEWLGDVPAHWAAVPLRRLLFAIEQGQTLDSENRLAEVGEWGVLKSGCVNGGKFRSEEHKALAVNTTFEQANEVKAGDILMSRASGSIELVGSVALVDNVRPGLLLSDKTFRLVPSNDILSEFLVAQLNAMHVRTQIKLLANGAEGLPNNITKPSINSLFVTLPPIEEQRAIVEYLARDLAEIELVVFRSGAMIALLRERRATLISAAVTGKIDVRNLAN